jgi:hypothetical protein
MSNSRLFIPGKPESPRSRRTEKTLGLNRLCCVRGAYFRPGNDVRLRACAPGALNGMS